MTRAELLVFLQEHRLGVQSTVSPSGEPQAAVVGIAVTPALEIVFDTLDTSRKCRNLRTDPRIAFVAWKGITHFRVRPTWIRYSDYNAPGEIVEIQV